MLPTRRRTQPARSGSFSADIQVLSSRQRQRERPPTVIVLDEIDEGVNHLEFAVDASLLGLDDADFAPTAPVAVRLTVGRTMSMFTVSGRVQTAVAGDCCRCLSPAQAKIDGDLRFLLQRKEASDVETEALEDQDDVDLVDPGTKEIDLTQRLHDILVLEMPMRLYCRDDCKGLCPQCGQDFNAGTCSCDAEVIDPRWAALAELQKKDQSKKSN